MSRKGYLIKNTFILSIGTFLPKILTILITPILTAQLTKTEYGQYDLITTLVSLLFPAVTLQVSAAAFRFLIDKRDEKQECGHIISSIYAFVIITASITSIIYIMFFYKSLGAGGSLICAYFVADIMFVTTGQVIRGLGKNLMYSVSTIIYSVLNVFFIALLTGVISDYNFGLFGVVASMLIANLIPLALLVMAGGIIPFVKISNVSLIKLKELIRYSWPMVPNNLSGWVLRLSDRIVITAVCGIEANAVYAAACKMPTIFSSFQNTFMMAWQESASLAMKDTDKDEYYRQMFSGVFRLLIGIMAILICATPIVWKLLIRGDYRVAYYQLPVLYLGVLFSCMSATIGGIYIAHKRTKSVGITTTLAAVLNLLIDLLLVHSIGIWAGSISTMISYLFLLIYRMIDVQRFQVIKFELKVIIGGTVLITIMGILCYQQNVIGNSINIVIALMAVYLFDRHIICGLISLLKKKLVPSKTLQR